MRLGARGFIHGAGKRSAPLQASGESPARAPFVNYDKGDSDNENPTPYVRPRLVPPGDGWDRDLARSTDRPVWEEWVRPVPAGRLHRRVMRREGGEGVLGRNAPSSLALNLGARRPPALKGER